MFKKRILIAGGDPQMVEAFRQAVSEQWEILSAASGNAALAEMDKQPCDVVVADMDLPELDGAELLTRIRNRYSKTVNFILANEADKERVMKHVLGAHQFLTKPCEPPKLKALIEKALELDVWIANNRMRELVARVRSFPTVPSLYLEVLAALRSPNATTEQVGAIIAKDMAMMTKMMQVLNSAYFGLPRKITDPVEAVGILGFESVKSMVMTIKLLSQYDKLKPVYFSIDRLWRHSTEVGKIAKQITQQETGDSAMAETAFTAGLMHDIGKVVLAANFDEQYRGAQSLAAKQKLPAWEVEKEIFGASHAEISAYLLGLWGMPLDLLEAAALHHQPGHSMTKSFTALTAVHVADAFEHELNGEKDGQVRPKIDESYLAEMGLAGRVDKWRDTVTGRPAAKPEIKAAQPIVRKPLPAPARSVPKPAPKPVSAGNAPAGSPAWLFTQKQWIFAGAGAAALLLTFVWLGSSIFGGKAKTSEAAKVEPAKPVIAAPQIAATQPAAKPEASAPKNSTIAAGDNKAAAPATKPTGTASIVARANSAPSAPVASAPVKPVSKAPTFADLKLQGIFYSSGKPSAIISGTTVEPGERFAGILVVDIGRSNVVVEYQNQRKTLTLVGN